MKKTLLLTTLLISFIAYSQNPNLVSNGNLEQWSFSSPNAWSSSSDFGNVSQNTTDFSEGSSSGQFINDFGGELSIFTTVDIPLQDNITYNLKFDYKYLDSNLNTSDNIIFSIFSIGTIIAINVEDNNWNSVEVEFTPTVTGDYELKAAVVNLNNVLIDDIIIEEKNTLSTIQFSLENEIQLVSLENKQILLKKSNGLKINSVTVFSVLGIKQNINSSQDFEKLNLQTLSAGIYLINISTDKGIVTKKVVIK